MAIEGNLALTHRYQGYTEHALIYRALCATLAGDRELLAVNAPSPAGWEILLEMAREEGLAPLLCWEFNQHGWPAGCPGSVHRSLEGEYYRCAARNALLISELCRILEVLQAAGIPVLVLKGAALAVSNYPDPALRPMTDLDLWIPRGQLELAISLLTDLGYGESHPELGEGLNRAVGYHAYLVNKSVEHVAVELHWNLIGEESDHRQPPQEWFWEHAQALTINDTYTDQIFTALCLDDTANLLYLVGHLYFKHGGELSQALWMYDVHLLIQTRGETIEWEELFRKAADLGWSAALQRIIEQIQARFGTSLPASALMPRATSSNTRSHPHLRQTGLPVDLKRNTWNYLSSLRWGARMRVLVALIFPSPAHMRWRYQPKPTWLWPLYYPYRWARMLWDAWGILLGSLSSRGEPR